ncbi:hypothetical protein IAU59_001784 [Kwoniella sp. CBS 9459]
MFAPRSQHIPRTHSVYHQPTTSKKNLNKENANANVFPSKTPSRPGKNAMGTGMGMGTAMRMGLGLKTEGRDRNVLGGGAGSGGQAGAGKGKGKADGSDIEPKRLFASTSTKSSLPPSKSLSSMPTIPPSGKTTTTTNAHRTPAPQRRTYQALRTPAPALLPDPAPTPLPSATRTRRRSRQSLSNISLTPIKAQIESHFVTPAPVAWEEELSLGSIEEVGHEVLQGVQEEQEEDWEPEYMPPPVEELPWAPAWDHPDLAQIFSILSALPPMWTISDEPTIKEVPPFEATSEEIPSLTLTGDDELEEDWLRPKPVDNQSLRTTKPRVTFGGVSAQSMTQGRTTARQAMVSPNKPSTTRPITNPPVSSLKPALSRPRPAAPTSTSVSLLASRTTASRSVAAVPARSVAPGKTITRPSAPVPRPPVVRGRAEQMASTMQKEQRQEAKVDPKDMEMMSSWGNDLGLEDEVVLNLDLDLGLDGSAGSGVNAGQEAEIEKGVDGLQLDHQRV